MRIYYSTLILLILLRLTNKAKSDSPINQFLGPQNAARLAVGHGLQPLKWDNKVAQFAESYANNRSRDCDLRHSNTSLYGENIFWGSGNEWTPYQAASDWADEKKFYNYRSNSCSSGQQCGHYTQIVWKDTKRIGCARIVCDHGKGVFMTCNYDPPGNYVGERGLIEVFILVEFLIQ